MCDIDFSETIQLFINFKLVRIVKGSIRVALF